MGLSIPVVVAIVIGTPIDRCSLAAPRSPVPAPVVAVSSEKRDECPQLHRCAFASTNIPHRSALSEFVDQPTRLIDGTADGSFQVGAPGRARVANSTRRANHSRSPSSPEAKNISLYQNSDLRHKSGYPEPVLRDVLRSSRNVGHGMRWTQLASGVNSAGRERKLRTAKSCGPGAATVASIHAGPCWRGNGDKKRRSPGRARSKPSNHCAGKAGVSG
jgi:hypothetical protein